MTISVCHGSRLLLDKWAPLVKRYVFNMDANRASLFNRSLSARSLMSILSGQHLIQVILAQFHELVRDLRKIAFPRVRCILVALQMCPYYPAKIFICFLSEFTQLRIVSARLFQQPSYSALNVLQFFPWRHLRLRLMTFLDLFVFFCLWVSVQISCTAFLHSVVHWPRDTS